jgi:hypothetical protein
VVHHATLPSLSAADVLLATTMDMVSMHPPIDAGEHVGPSFGIG